MMEQRPLKKKKRYLPFNDLNTMLVDGNKVKQQKIDLMKESEVTDDAYNLMPRKEFINAQNKCRDEFATNHKTKQRYSTRPR